MFALCRCTAHKHPITALICRADGQQYCDQRVYPSVRSYGGAENASTGKRMYGKCKYNANLQSDKKFGTSPFSVVHFQVGWESGLQIVFF